MPHAWGDKSSSGSAGAGFDVNDLSICISNATRDDVITYLGELDGVEPMNAADVYAPRQ